MKSAVIVTKMASEIESLETTSTSLSEDSLNISFEDITYSVRTGVRRGHKMILNNMSGQFNAGELTVVMGQSGAGKSSLMDILSGYTKPTSGNIFINGRIRNEKKFRRRSCYILQDDRVQDQLTIKESLDIATQLKLGDHISKEQKNVRVDEIITSLGLHKVRDTRAGLLSGGQKKRLAIGLELINDPPVMFLDEPISGLDSSISKQIVYLLHLLARQGRTVVVTIHQPSAALLQMVDRVYAISAGQCVYMGSVPSLLRYLDGLGMKCPPYHNPVDFLIEISTENVKQLVECSENGKNPRWVANIMHETDLEVKYNLCNFDEVFLTTLPAPKEDPTSKILLAIKSTYATSRWQQFLTLTKRSLLSSWRDSQYTFTTLGIHLAMALFLGTLFFNIGEDATYIRDNYNFLYFNLMFLMFTAFSSMSINFPERIPVVRREHFNRWYSTSAYYASTLVASLPMQTICTLTYTCIVYWMSGQPVEFFRYFIFTSTLLAISYVALWVGLLNGSMFNVQYGVMFGPFMIMPFTIFSGFFLKYSDAPYIFRWMFHISFLKHGLVGVMIAIFGDGRPKLPCKEMYCYERSPTHFLQENDMLGETLTLVSLALLAISFVVITSAYIILRFRLKRKW